MAEREHLDLVELVRAEDAARVLARRAGLAAEARREPAVAQREVLLGQDLAHVQRRPARPRRCRPGTARDRRSRPRRPARAPRGRSRVPTSASSRTSTGGHDRREALADELVERVLHGRDVQAHEVAEQVGEARARRCARRARCRSCAPARSRWSRGSKSNSGFGPARHVVQLRVLLEHAVGGGRVREVRAARAWPSRTPRRPRAAAPRAPPGGRAARPPPRISAAASRPARLASPIACAAVLRSARSSSTCVCSARRRSSSASTSSSRPSASRRASAARTRSVSERMQADVEHACAA